MSMTETPVGITSGSTDKRHRATAVEMEERKQRAVEVAKNSASPVTQDQIRIALGLTPPNTVALVRSLIDEGRLQMAGKNGRRLLLKVGRKAKATAPATTPDASTPKTPKPRATALNVNDILSQLHIGAEYEMIGLQVKKDSGITIDLVEKSVPGGRVLTVALAGAK